VAWISVRPAPCPSNHATAGNSKERTMKELSAEAIEILRGVQVCILREPELYDQTQCPMEHMTCDSPCCFAGWAAWVKGGEKLFNHYLKPEGIIEVDALAEILGIDWGQAEELFSEWPDLVRPAWDIPCTKAAAIDGAAYIDEFIAKYGPKEKL
jgi:hypothetical protein